MPVKKSSSPPVQYNSAYRGESARILKLHGDKNLFNEIELLRYLNLVVLQQMNAKKKKLTYHDYLATLRIFSHSAGRIAHLVDIQYRVFSPRQQLEQAHKEEMERAFKGIMELSELLMGEEKVGKIQFDALMQVLHGEDWQPLDDDDEGEVKNEE